MRRTLAGKRHRQGGPNKQQLSKRRRGRQGQQQWKTLKEEKSSEVKTRERKSRGRAQEVEPATYKAKKSFCTNSVS